MENNKWDKILTIEIGNYTEDGFYDARSSLSENHFGEVADVLVKQMQKYPKFKEAVMAACIKAFGKSNPNVS